MVTTDPIADFLTRIRNAQKAQKRLVTIPKSKMKAAMCEILKDQGYIHDFKVDEKEGHENLILALKYSKGTNIPAITSLKRISKPGLRKYCNKESMPRVLNGLGIAILSTSAGIMTDKEAKTKNVGGEVLCYIY